MAPSRTVRRRRPLVTGAAALATVALGAGVAYAAAGEQDPGFHAGSARLIPFTGDGPDRATRVVVAPDGSLVVAGCGCNPEHRSIGLARLTPAGDLVSGFGTGGTVVTDVEGLAAEPTALALGEGGSILVGTRAEQTIFEQLARAPRARALSYGVGGAENDGDFTVLRYSGGGVLDGQARVELPGYDAHLVGLVPLPGGGLLAAGDTTRDDGLGAVAIARLDASGALDPGFDGDGTLVDGPVVPAGFQAIGAAHQAGGPAGSIVLAGVTQEEERRVVVLRYLADGALDAGYGTKGVGSAPFPVTADRGAFALGADGAAYVGGGDEGFVVRRFDPTGTPDGAWGAGGEARAGFGGAAARVAAIGVQPDGKIVATGYADDHVALARFTVGGQLDPSFGSGGTVVLPLAEGAGAMTPHGLAMQDDGKPVVAGAAGFPFTETPTVAGLRARQLPGSTQGFVTRIDAGPASPAPTGTTETTPPPNTTTDTTTTATTPPAAAPAAAVSAAGSLPLPSARSCVSRRSFKIRLRVPRGGKAISAAVKVNGKKVSVLRGARLKAPVDLRGLPKGRFTVSIAVKLADGTTLKGQRRYRTCAAKHAGGVPKV
jgi:uncharacterized delta-60 repeat protein